MTIQADMHLCEAIRKALAGGHYMTAVELWGATHGYPCKPWHVRQALEQMRDEIVERDRMLHEGTSRAQIVSEYALKSEVSA